MKKINYISIDVLDNGFILNITYTTKTLDGKTDYDESKVYFPNSKELGEKLTELLKDK